jgi:beta-glucosidase-like glycosyl hydrolase
MTEEGSSGNRQRTESTSSLLSSSPLNRNISSNNIDNDDITTAGLSVIDSVDRIVSVIRENMSSSEKIHLLTGGSFWTTSKIRVPSSSSTIIMPPTRMELQQQQQSFSDTASTSSRHDKKRSKNTTNTLYLTMCDGPHGVRKPVVETSLQESYVATCFPTASALACSWDGALLQTVGRALRDECILRQVNIVLGPGLNLKRHACNGRNFEYFSEDPLLSGRLASALVCGIQEPYNPNDSNSNNNTNQDDTNNNTNNSIVVGSCIKHFAVNNQETHRFVVDAIVDERTLRELYWRSFEIVMKGGS